MPRKRVKKATRTTNNNVIATALGLAGSLSALQREVGKRRPVGRETLKTEVERGYFSREIAEAVTAAFPELSLAALMGVAT